ncbi:hypothetical protein DEA8626_02347 [Defluviimonas aquaemixtae]|uniref:SGNH/GDSL hydrolase family protein n=1 Tax=Albidovulum aquaemixtae TaxID=1542388 RepID=A0A2R8B894_9RHOB|nr:hypothetical protein [Defluviimonas aquaemixtae]SPH18802.1 hypothetical protein DEA8626_02347 [Defluviimonas aquaemixtae]
MDSLSRTPPTLPWARIAAFLGVCIALYVAAAVVAEFSVGRRGEDTALQKLYAARGAPVDWVVLGASHALPLDYGGIPDQLHEDTGQTMIVLAEVGAGPYYSDFVLRQALEDLHPKRLLYVADSFAFRSARWNKERIADRKLLRNTPLRLSTLCTMLDLTISADLSARAVLDFATAFSKINPPDRFPRDDWRGAENFERRFRPSRHATAARIEYLYPEPPSEETQVRYFQVLEAMFARARSAGLSVTVVKMPVPRAFRDALPDEATFDTALRARLAPLGIPIHDFSAILDDPVYYFDTDHLNREGVDRLYDEFLRPILAAGG